MIKTGVGAVWALRQIEILIGEGIEVHVALGEPGPMSARYQNAGAIVHQMPIDIARIVREGPIAYLTAARHFRNLVSTVAPDVIHSHFVGTTLFARLTLGRMAKVPRIFQVPGPLHLEKTFSRIADLYSSGPRDHFVASCELTRDLYLQNGVSPDKVHLSYYGTHIDAFQPVTRDRSNLTAMGIPTDATVIGMVAYMYPPKTFFGQKAGLKGHEDLIEAIGLLLDRGRNVAAVFVGGAWGEAHEYEAHLRQLGQARLGPRGVFLGTRNDVRRLYQSFDLVVHPSHSENLGGAGESLLLGVPTIATRVGGFPDIVQHEKTGLLVPPHSPEALAEAIEATLNDPARTKAMADDGIKLAQRLLDVRKTGREIAVIYQKVLEVRRK